MESYFKSEEGREQIISLYDRKLQDLNISSEYITVKTSFGETNIIATGNSANPPMIIVHGSNGCAPISLETYPSLSKDFRVYAVDVLSQPNKSAGTRLSMKDKSYGQWMNEVFDKLELDNVEMVGFSFGGLVILKTLEFDERRVKQVYLSAPAYIVNGNPIKAIFKMFIPMKRYMKTEKMEYLEKFLSEVFTERDPFAISFLSKVFLHFEMDFSPVPTISKKAAALITTPITLFAAGKDVIFPGSKMIKRAKKIFPSLASSTLCENSRHVLGTKENRAIEAVILKHKAGSA